jgi:hypothetical protein
MPLCPHCWTENPGRKESVQFSEVVFISRSRRQAKTTGVTIRMHARLLSMPPMTGVASGFITSAPVRQARQLQK